MAALTHRGIEATYTIHEKITVNTSDREDHSFCGIMFPLECKEILPVESVVITSLSVRGQLGPLTVWVSNNPDEAAINKNQTSRPNKQALKTSCASTSSRSICNSTHVMNTRSKVVSHQGKKKFHNAKHPSTKKKYTITANQAQWTKIYDQTLHASVHTYRELDLSQSPIHLKPGQVRGVYIHSTLDNDKAIVYDNYLFNDASVIPEDPFLRLRPAMAHVSTKPFGSRPIWGGGMGEAWRRDRTFVGKIDYGVVYKLWNPNEHLLFGCAFQNVAMQLFACQRKLQSPISRLPDDCIFYILNMCKWDWVGDNSKGMKKLSEKRKAKVLTASKEDSNEETETTNEEEVEDIKPSSVAWCESVEMKENEHDFVEEENMEIDDEYDEDSESDTDDIDFGFDDRGPILYRDGEDNEPTVSQTYRRQNLRHYGNNRQYILGNFLAAFLLAETDDDDNTMAVMMDSDDELGA